ncbi:MAG: TatD family deoxyribonuclease [Coriobacteriaceae bacterium]|nr:TatD family deoxyribonuclease [Coriobacteriaceae bacterium]
MSGALEPLVFCKRSRNRVRGYPAPVPLAPLADTHAHLTCFWEKDPASCLARAALVGVRQLTTLFDPVGDDMGLPDFQVRLRSWLADARRLIAEGEGAGAAVDDPSALIDRVRYLVGVHPYGAPAYTDEIEAVLYAALVDDLCAGIGEIGLDYHVDLDDRVEPAPRGLQIEVFSRQLSIAAEGDLPVELHLRNAAGDTARAAHADAFRVLADVGVPRAGCVLHCFGEDRATMERACELGCHIAYGGAATFNRNEGVREAFAATPLDRILFETDCPYMAPMPLRGSECEPAMVTFTADALARDRAARTGEDPAAIQRAAWGNAVRLFG